MFSCCWSPISADVALGWQELGRRKDECGDSGKAKSMKKRQWRNAVGGYSGRAVCVGAVQVLCKISVREHRQYSCVALEGSGATLHCGC